MNQSQQTTPALTLFTQLPHWLEWAGFALIIVLAAFLRLRAVDLTEFKRDEANVSVLAMDMAHGRQIPLLGIDSSVGIRNSPMSIYLMVPPFLVSDDPRLATAYVGLLNVLAVGLLYALMRRYYGPPAALMTGVLYAASIWAVIYSRKIWAQDLLPLFVILTIGTGLLGFLEGKRWAQLLHLPLLAITGQIHYAAVVLLPITLLLIVTGRRHLTRYFLFSFALMVLVCLPFIIGATQNTLISTDGVKHFASSPDKPTKPLLTLGAINFTLMTITGTGIDTYFVNNTKDPLTAQFLVALPNFTPLLIGLTLTIAAATLWLIIRTIKQRKTRQIVDVTLLLWFLVTPLLFSFTWTTVYPHYMIIMIPGSFAVFGAAFADLWEKLSRQWKTQPRVRIAVGVVSAMLAVLVAVAQVSLHTAALDFVNIHTAHDGFGIPIGYYMPIREAVLHEQPQQVLASLDGQYIGFHEETTIWNALLYSIPLKRYLDDGTEVYPAEPALYLSHQCKTAEQKFAARPGEACYGISNRTADQFKLTNYQSANENKLTFANGARIIAYRWEPEVGCLNVVWTLNNEALKEDFQIGVQFLNESKQQVGSGDSLGWRGLYWRKGDTLIKRFCLHDPNHKNEIVGVRLGMYLLDETPDGPKYYNQDLYDPNGVVTGQMLEIMFPK